MVAVELVVVAVAAGVSLAVLSGGTLTRLLDTPVRLPVLALAALALQLVLGLWTPGDGWPERTGLALYLGSFAVVAVFCSVNLRLTGMSVVLVGVVLNGLVVALNGAMPVRLPADAGGQRRADLEASVTHVDEDDARTLAFLGQVVPVPEPVDRPVSFGDLILGVGLVDVLFRASRPAAGRARRGGSGSPARERPVGDDAGEREHDPAIAPTGH